MSETNQPKKSYKVNDVEVAVWENVVKKKDGNGAFTKQSVSIRKNYNKDGEWKSTPYIPLESVPAVKELLTKVMQEQAIKEGGG